MAKVGMVQRELKRKKLEKKYRNKREALREIACDRDASPEEVFKARQSLAKLPKNSAKSRQRNRCQLTGRPRAFYRRFNLCRVMLREKASLGELPGVTKSSW